MLRRYGLAFLCAVLFIPAAQAGTKEEIIQLQTDVVQLQTKIVDLQRTMDTQTRAMRDLLTQIKDDLGNTSASVRDIRKQLANQQGEMDVSVRDIAKKVTSLGEKLDETNQRLTILGDQISKQQLKEVRPDGNQPGAEGAPQADKLYDNAYKDFLQGNFELALDGFQKFVRYYGRTDKAPEAQYYIGESLYAMKRFGDAIKAYDEINSNYPAAPVNAPALFKAGNSFMELGNRNEAISRYQAVVEKFPEAPEASLAKKRLELLGANTRPAGSRPKTTTPRRRN